MTMLRFTIALVTLLAAAMAQAFTFSYGGRLVDAQGRPVKGPVALSVSFYGAATGGSPTLTITDGLTAVPLQEGIFQIAVPLAGADLQAAFPTANASVWIEITDLTNRPAQPYDRQLVSMMPFAAKIPVDAAVLEFNADGALTLKNATGPAPAPAPAPAPSPSPAPASGPVPDSSLSSNVSLLGQTIELGGGEVAGTLPIARGGTGATTTAGAANALLPAQASNAGKYLVTDGTNVSWSNTLSTTSRLQVGDGGSGGITAENNGNTGVIWNALNSLQLYSGGLARLTVDPQGEVGIGTTSPGAPLDVLRSTTLTDNADLMRLRNYTAGGGGGAYPYSVLVLDVNQPNGGGCVKYAVSGVDGATTCYSHFTQKFTLGFGAHAMTLDGASGNVGIGTAAPAEKLAVAGPVRVTAGGTTSLSAGHNAVETTLNVASTAGFPDSGTIVIRASWINEVITYTGKTNNTFTGCVRGAFGTTADITYGGESVYLYLLSAGSAANATPDFVVTSNGRASIGTGTVSNAGLTIASGTANYLHATDQFGRGFAAHGNHNVNFTKINTGSGAMFTFNGDSSLDGSGAGDYGLVSSFTFDPTTGSSNYAAIADLSTINQTGGTGIARGLYIAPTVTNAIEYRAIETTTGKVLFNGGTVGIGVSSPEATLDVAGTARLASYTAAPFACTAAKTRTLAMTSLFTLCVCKGATTTWVHTSDGTTACVWQ